jgi:soluble lytic murein transglycosylase
MGPIRTGEHLTRRHRSRLAFCAAAGVAALASSGAGAVDTLAKPPQKPDAAAVAKHIIPLPRPRPRLTAARNEPVSAPHQQEPVPVVQRREPLPTGSVHASLDSPEVPGEPLAPPPVTASAADLATAHDALALARRSKTSDATDLQSRISDPLTRKIVEWAILRGDDNTANFSRYQAFLAANPNWPSNGMFRRRAEVMLWQEHADLATIRAFTGDKPLSERGKFALARAFLEQGDKHSAEPLFRDAWRTGSLQPEAEEQLLDIFGDLLTRADDKARMERRLYANDVSGALRAAHRLGGVEPAIVKARAAVNEKSPTAKSLIEALPSSAHQDPGVMFSRIQMLRRADKYQEAAQLMLAAPHDVALIYDPDEWWIERRVIARKLLDLNQAATAYKIVRDAATPTKENFKVEHEFTAGWIALRFLKDPAGAAQHFARITGISNPIAMARANYWRGRAAEAMNKPQDARAFYEQAAHYSTAYYGQLARAKLGMHELALVSTPLPASDKRAALARNEVVRAVETLYTLNDRDLVIPIVADLADRSPDMAMLAALAEVAARHDDARSALLVGKGALGRGQPFDQYAYPTFGLPPYAAIGPAVEQAVVYSIARQESAFNPKDVSSAHALGLMQVTPEAGRYVAKKFNVAYDQDRLLNDNVYNMQIGTAELGDNIASYNGSFILAFAGYNAGRGRVKEWIERYGDPRDPKVDPIDWVERIPFSETRNYVQRIIENIQVYRARFGSGSRLMIEADLRRGGSAN